MTETQIPKTRKIAAQEAEKDNTPVSISIDVYERQEVIPIRPIETLGDWVVIMPFAIKTLGNILLPNQMDYQEVGIVVGRSDSIPTPSGNYAKSVLKIGDVVRFSKRAVLQTLELDEIPYVRRRLVILSEKNILVRLPVSAKFKVV